MDAIYQVLRRGGGAGQIDKWEADGEIGSKWEMEKKYRELSVTHTLEGRWKWVTVSPFHATLKTVPSLPFLGAQVRVFSYYVPTPGVA